MKVVFDIPDALWADLNIELEDDGGKKCECGSVERHIVVFLAQLVTDIKMDRLNAELADRLLSGRTNLDAVEDAIEHRVKELKEAYEL